MGDYIEEAEFHDLFMVEPWERLRPHVATAFGGLSDKAIVVEIGAGTGMGTRVIATESQARIAALEPGLVMRTVLTMRVADNTELSSRVTIVAGSAPDDLDRLPIPIDGFVCAHMLGHLDRDGRRQLFEWLDENLSDTGIGLVTTHQETGTTDDTHEHQPETRDIGDYQYRAAFAEDGPGRFSTRYEVWEGDTMVRDLEVAGSFDGATANDLADIVSGLRLSAETVAGSVAVVRRRCR